MKKSILISVFFSLILFLSTNNSFSTEISHKVKNGDNLYTIAKKYHTSVDSIKNINGLNSSKLKIGQTLIVKKDGSGKTNKKVAKKKNTKIIQQEVAAVENDGEFIEYKTKKGDTLEKISLRFNIDMEEILESNNIKEGKQLAPNKIILIPKVYEEKEEEFVTLTSKNIKPWKSNEEKYMLVKVAKSFMGAPYKYGGNSVRGLDCSAYVKKIYDIFDVQLPRSARDQFKVGSKINKEDLAIGDLVFFRTKRYIKYPTHVGIYIGDGNFIHSSSGNRRIGVKIDSLSSDFYSRTYVGATRIKKPIDESADATKTTTPEKDSDNS